MTIPRAALEHPACGAILDHNPFTIHSLLFLRGYDVVNVLRGKRLVLFKPLSRD